MIGQLGRGSSTMLVVKNTLTSRWPDSYSVDYPVAIYESGHESAEEEGNEREDWILLWPAGSHEKADNSQC